MSPPVAGLTWRTDEPLDRHTAWRTGGRCAHYVVVHHQAALPDAMARIGELPGTPLVLGAATRTVFRDGDYDRVVLRLGAGFCTVDGEREALEFGAAMPAPAAAWIAAARGGGGLHELARTPGSLGAALALDEGPWREHLVEVRLWSRGDLRWKPADKAMGARLILGARFALPAVPAATGIDALIDALRGAHSLPSWYQPLRRGSVGDEIARVGVAGARIRGASIPESAPEMVVNAGRGPAADLQLLQRSAIERVGRMRGVKLESSLSFLGRS